jgi:hypothetical protein
MVTRGSACKSGIWVAVCAVPPTPREILLFDEQICGSVRHLLTKNSPLRQWRVAPVPVRVWTIVENPYPYQGMTAVASISTLAASSIKAVTWTTDITG